MAPLLDLVEDSKLHAKFVDDVTTVHTYIEPDGFRRRIHREEYWRRERRIGQGGFGQVQLERCVQGKKQGATRAVKILYKPLNPSSRANFTRELEAIAKFSHERVRSKQHRGFDFV
jgi:hypothetical protein